MFWSPDGETVALRPSTVDTVFGGNRESVDRVPRPPRRGRYKGPGRVGSGVVVDLAAPTLALVLGAVLFGGLVKGLVGFGYAVAGTALLATLLDPATAVVVMILPTLAANVTLLGSLSPDSMRSCARRFWPYVAAATVGTLLGMTVVARVPQSAVALGLGVLTLGYVLGKQRWVDLPGEAWLRERCFRSGTPAKVGLGFASGVVFGASNVAVQVVAYLDSLSLDRTLFVGVLAMVLVGISSVRVVAAWVLGLYEAGGVATLSVAAVVPGILGVAVGGRLREQLPERHVSVGVLVLLAVVGVRLLTNGVRGL